MTAILDKRFIAERKSENPALSCDIADYPEGIIIPIDKPYKWTSADVIRKVKYAACRHFGKKKLKVGHAGTLDPLATGVLLVCIGNATKQAETLQSHDKEYIAGVCFGATTPSYDLEKEIDRYFPHEHITEDRIRGVLPDFIGEQEQIAPLFSAKSIDGVRAYELARKLYKSGQIPHQVQDDTAALIRAAKINISDMELLSFERGKSGQIPHQMQDDAAEVQSDAAGSHAEPVSATASSRINVTDNSALGLPTATIRVACSKGTYIRALARDLGEALDSGAHLSSLQRSRSGDFKVENALSIDETMALINNADNRG